MIKHSVSVKYTHVFKEKKTCLEAAESGDVISHTNGRVVRRLTNGHRGTAVPAVVKVKLMLAAKAVYCVNLARRE